MKKSCLLGLESGFFKTEQDYAWLVMAYVAVTLKKKGIKLTENS